MERKTISKTLIAAGALYFTLSSLIFLTTGPIDISVAGISIKMHSIRSPLKSFLYISLAAMIISFDHQAWGRYSDIIRKKMDESPRTEWAVCLSITVLAGTVISILRLMQFFMLRTNCLDHGIYANVAWNATHGNDFYSSLQEIHFLGDHFSPILFAAGLQYSIWNNAGILLVSQSMLLALGGIAVYLIALHVTRDRALSLLFMLFYLSNYYLHTVARFEFQPAAIAIPVFLWMLYFMEKKKSVPFFLLAAMSLTIKENVPVALAGLGLFMFTKKEMRRFAVPLFLVSVSMFIIEIKILIPMFLGNENLVNMDRYSNFGSGSDEILKNILLNPVMLLNNTVLDAGKLISLLKLLFSFSLLPLLAGPYILPSVFPVMFNLISGYKGQWSFKFHYSAESIPFMLFASIYGARTLLEFSGRRLPENRARVLLYLVLACFIVAGLSNFGRYVSPDRNVAHINEFFRIKDQFSADDRICAQSALGPHLALRKYIFMFSSDVSGSSCLNSDYIVLDTEGSKYPFISEEGYFTAVLGLLKNPDYGIIHNRNGIMVLKKGHSTENNMSAIMEIGQGAKKLPVN